MHPYSRTLFLTAAATIAIAAIPATSRAQTALHTIVVTERRQQAERLDREAHAIEGSDWSRLLDASRLRARAADLRSPDDPKGTLSLYWAASDRYYADHVGAARDLMERTGDRAVAIGDVVTAATAFTDAAFMSAELRDGARMREFAERARLLTSSPMLSEVQRVQLRSRLGGDGSYVSVAMVPKP